MVFYIDNLIIYLTEEESGIRLKTNNDNMLLVNQTFTETMEVVEKNYEIVKGHFQPKVGEIINEEDLKEVCLKIVFYYLSMYNLWRVMYKREKNRDLTFLVKDFQHPYTNDVIIRYFKEKYPDNYSDKCETMLNMSPEKFRAYDKNRQDFQNMF